MDEAALFDQLDTDGNGVIDEEELGAAIESMGVPIKVNQLLSMLDANGDGVIDQAEFHGFYQMFAASDDRAEREENENTVADNDETEEEVDQAAVVEQIFREYSGEEGKVVAGSIANKSMDFFGVDRHTYLRLLSTNGYELSSKLRQSDLANIYAICRSLERLDDEIDLMESSDESEIDILIEKMGGHLEEERNDSASGKQYAQTQNEGDDYSMDRVDDARVVYDCIDIDGDGLVSFDEMCMALVEMGIEYHTAKAFARDMCTDETRHAIGFNSFKLIYFDLLASVGSKDGKSRLNNDESLDPDKGNTGFTGLNKNGVSISHNANNNAPVTLDQVLKIKGQTHWSAGESRHGGGGNSPSHSRTLSVGSTSSADSHESLDSQGRRNPAQLRGGTLEEGSKMLDQRLDHLQEANRLARKREVELQLQIEERKSSLYNLQKREEQLKENICNLQNDEESLRIEVQNVSARVEVQRQRESELQALQSNLKESVAKIKTSIRIQSDDAAEAAIRGNIKEKGGYDQHAILLKYIATLEGDRDDISQKFEELTVEFEDNNAIIQDLLHQASQDDQKMEDLKQQVQTIQEGNMSLLHNRRSSQGLDTTNVSSDMSHGTLAFDLSFGRTVNNISNIDGDTKGATSMRFDSPQTSAPPTPGHGEESLGSILAPEGGNDVNFLNLTLPLDMTIGVHQSDDEDPGTSLGLEGTSLADCESFMEGPVGGFGTTSPNTRFATGTTNASGNPHHETSVTSKFEKHEEVNGNEGKTCTGPSQSDWADARAATYACFVNTTISALQRIKTMSHHNSQHFGPKSHSSQSDQLVAEAVELEKLLLGSANEGSFHNLYESLSKREAASTSSSTATTPLASFSQQSRQERHTRHISRTILLGGQKKTSASGAIGLLLQEAVKLSALSGIVHENKLNREEKKTNADKAVPDGSFRCKGCGFINANIRLRCKKCSEHRFQLFDRHHLATVQNITMQNTSGILKTQAVLATKKYQFKVHGGTRITYYNLKTKKQKSYKYSDIAAVSLDKRTLRITFKPAKNGKDLTHGDSKIVNLDLPGLGNNESTGDEDETKHSQTGGPSLGVTEVFKAVSEKTAETIYACIKQRIDRAAAVSALETQERVRMKHQKFWVNHLQKCCDDVFDDVLGSSAGKSILQAQADAMTAQQNTNNQSAIISGVRELFRTAAMRKLIKKFDKIYPSLSATLAGVTSSKGKPQSTPRATPNSTPTRKIKEPSRFKLNAET